MKQEKKDIIKKFKPFLWSYDTGKMDLDLDKKRIITNVLNLGTKEATNLLFKTYKQYDIIDAIINSLPGEWNNKSLNYWSIIFNITPKKTYRKII